jgi:hypothetical protein
MINTRVNNKYNILMKRIFKEEYDEIDEDRLYD